MIGVIQSMSKKQEIDLIPSMSIECENFLIGVLDECEN